MTQLARHETVSVDESSKFSIFNEIYVPEFYLWLNFVLDAPKFYSFYPNF